jgi:hypothetical protein
MATVKLRRSTWASAKYGSSTGGNKHYSDSRRVLVSAATPSFTFAFPEISSLSTVVTATKTRYRPHWTARILVKSLEVVHRWEKGKVLPFAALMSKFMTEIRD